MRRLADAGSPRAPKRVGWLKKSYGPFLDLGFRKGSFKGIYKGSTRDIGFRV